MSATLMNTNATAYLRFFDSFIALRSPTKKAMQFNEEFKNVYNCNFKTA